MAMFWGSWIGMTLVTLVFLAFLGVVLRDSLWGTVQDPTGAVSVPRVQLVMWTVVCGPMVVAMAMWRLSVAPAGFDLGTPGQLVGCMAITLGTALGAAAMTSTGGGEDDEGTRRHLDLVQIQGLIVSTGVLIGYVALVISGYLDVPLAQAPASLPTISPSWVIILALSQSAILLSAVAIRDADHAEEGIAPLASHTPMAA